MNKFTDFPEQPRVMTNQEGEEYFTRMLDQIAAFNPDTTSVTKVMPLFPNGEDFTIDEQGNYWTGNGSKLYMRSVNDTRWQLMADFKAFGIRNITRLAVNLNSNQITLVSDLVVAD